MKDIINLMKIEAHGYNKHLTDDYLNALAIDELRCFIHPLSREYYDKRIREINRNNETNKI